MAKKKNPNTAYGTELISAEARSNHPIRSKYTAAALSMILGIFGIHQFYLRNVIRGLLTIVFTLIFFVLDYLFTPPLILVPVAVTVFRGLFYLIQSDDKFMKKNHVRIV